jgi:hypothetical protein
MSAFIFPYGIRLQENSRIEVFPAADITILGKSGRGIRAVFHIDSGATTSILPAGDAAVLGTDLSRDTKMIVRGLGDAAFIGYKHKIRFMLGNFSVVAPAIFVERSDIPRILGREGIFPRFGIIFDEAKRRSAFLDVKEERKRIDSMFQ